MKAQRLVAKANRKISYSVSMKFFFLGLVYLGSLLGSYYAGGLFFKELSVSGVIICLLMWNREMSESFNRRR